MIFWYTCDQSHTWVGVLLHTVFGHVLSVDNTKLW